MYICAHKISILTLWRVFICCLMQSAKPKQRKRATKSKNVNQQEESEW